MQLFSALLSHPRAFYAITKTRGGEEIWRAMCFYHSRTDPLEFLSVFCSHSEGEWNKFFAFRRWDRSEQPFLGLRSCEENVKDRTMRTQKNDEDWEESTGQDEEEFKKGQHDEQDWAHLPIQHIHCLRTPANLQFHRPDMFQLRQFSKRTERMAAAADAVSSFHHRRRHEKGSREESYYVLSDEEAKEPNLSLIILMKIFWVSLARSLCSSRSGFLSHERHERWSRTCTGCESKRILFSLFRAPIVSLPHSFRSIPID